MTKPIREWWIYKESDDSEGYVLDEKPKPPHDKSYVHVVEKSAYDSLMESMILAKKQRDQFEVECNSLKEQQKSDRALIERCQSLFELYLVGAPEDAVGTRKTRETLSAIAEWQKGRGDG